MIVVLLYAAMQDRLSRFLLVWTIIFPTKIFLFCSGIATLVVLVLYIIGISIKLVKMHQVRAMQKLHKKNLHWVLQRHCMENMSEGTQGRGKNIALFYRKMQWNFVWCSLLICSSVPWACPAAGVPPLPAPSSHPGLDQTMGALGSPHIRENIQPRV